MQDVSTAVKSLLARALGAGSRQYFEAFESRAMLANTPLPALGDLENVNNSVVRIETNYGDVDIELFNQAAPITVQNFLGYITRGQFDNTFFHRSPDNFVLQGGGFTYNQTSGELDHIPTQDPIIRESTGRSNLQRTIAMARTNVLDSATSEFFINYVDNTNLDTFGGGYAVFGRVIQGWDVVTTISNLRRLHLAPPSAQDPRPDERNDAYGEFNDSGFADLPVGTGFTEGQAIETADLVNLINAEIIKPQNVDGFFSHRVVMPEGFRSGQSREFLELANPNNASATYQVIARYEVGDRDVVIASGTLNANTKQRITLSDFGDTANNLVRQNSPYSLWVESAFASSVNNPGAVSAASNRVDYGAAEGEGFFNTDQRTPNGSTDDQLMVWDFARIERNELSREYLVWTNLDDEATVVTVTLVTSTGLTTFTRTLDAYRRGGLDLATLDLPPGVMAARVAATQPIVAMMSDWDLPSAGLPIVNDQSPFTPAMGVMGTPNGGNTVGGLASVSDRAGYTDTISVLNPSTTVAVVTFQYWRANRQANEDPVARIEIVPSQSRTDIPLDAGLLGLLLGEEVTVTYSSGSAPVTMQFTSVPDTGRNQNVPNTSDRDAKATAFVGRLGEASVFADGQLDPTRDATTQGESISIFNPYASTNVPFNYTVRYSFSDGTTIDAFTGSLAARQRVTLRTLDSAGVRNKAQSGAQFRTYAITVIGSAVNGASTVNVAGLVSFERFDRVTGRDLLTSGTASRPSLSLGDSSFQPPQNT